MYYAYLWTGLWPYFDKIGVFTIPVGLSPNQKKPHRLTGGVQTYYTQKDLVMITRRMNRTKMAPVDVQPPYPVPPSTSLMEIPPLPMV